MIAKQTVIRWTASSERMPRAFEVCYTATNEHMLVGVAAWDGERWVSVDRTDRRALRQDIAYWRSAHDDLPVVDAGV